MIQFFGLLCIALALLMGLLATKDSTGGVLAGFFWVMALLFSIIGIIAFRYRARHDLVVFTRAPKPTGRPNSGRQYEDFDWGDPAPTRKQFGYAMHLGAKIRNGMTKWMMSDAIDEAIEEQRSGEPATKEQLQTIKNYHGVLPRAVTRGEAKIVIENLGEYYLPCPFCGIEICATDNECCACNKNLRKMKIPIKL